MVGASGYLGVCRSRQCKGAWPAALAALAAKVKLATTKISAFLIIQFLAAARRTNENVTLLFHFLKVPWGSPSREKPPEGG
jgi:hypothetical protein